MIEQVTVEIDRAAKNGLGAVASMRGTHTAIVKNADIVNATIRLHHIIIEQVEIVTINIYRGSTPIGISLWRAIGRDANAVMEIGYGVVSDHMAWAINLDRIV